MKICCHFFTKTCICKIIKILIKHDEEARRLGPQKQGCTGIYLEGNPSQSRWVDFLVSFDLLCNH